MKVDMNFTGVSDADCNAVIKVLVEANKRRAKERVREYRQGIRGKKWLEIKYKLLEWLS